MKAAVITMARASQRARSGAGSAWAAVSAVVRLSIGCRWSRSAAEPVADEVPPPWAALRSFGVMRGD
ncbi:hypothetical protein GCM10017687_48130 [Streptomyces echinatus]